MDANKAINKSSLTNSDLSHSAGLKFIGKIRDPLHDTIPFTEAEKYIINHRHFQRLRRIQQTAFIKYVFPGANHTRFEHALGAMHLSGVMLKALVANQQSLLAEIEFSLAELPSLVQASFEMTELHYGSLRATKNVLQTLSSDPYIAQCLRFAALLHDVGHAPFSHSCERFMPSWAEFEEKFEALPIPAFLKEAFAKKCEGVRRQYPNYRSLRIRHEIYTLLIVVKMFDKESEFINAQMCQDVCAVLDKNVSPAPGGPLEKSHLQSLLYEIVSGEFDVDRMDYLLRDAKQCGVVYGLFDAGRILDSTCFYFDTTQKKFHLALRRSGIAAFEDYLRARWSMYQQVYFHKTATACEAMLESIHKSLGKFTLPLDTDEFLKLDDNSFYSYALSFDKEGKNEFARKMLNDLLFERKLWKRIYEENTPLTATLSTPSLCPAMMSFLRKQNIPCESIESGTSLTRFSPKGRHSRSSNSLKVIVKDVHSLRYLEPIENHSKLVNRLDEETLVRRIFIARYQEDGTEIDSKEIQRLVSSTVIMPKLD